MLAKIGRLANTAADTIWCWGELAYLEFLARRRALGNVPITNDVLMIAWQFPPTVTGGVYRPLSFAKHFTKMGQALTVLCAEPSTLFVSGGAQLAAQVPSEVRVSRMRVVRKREPGWTYFPHVDGGMPLALSMTLHALGLYGKTRPKVVLASGPPFHNAVVGNLLSEIWDVPLVVDYRDEWTQNPMQFVSRTSDDRAWETRANKRAARIVVVSESQRVHHEKAFALALSACSVVTNGWEPEYHGVETAHLRPDFAPLRAIQISFTGLLATHTAPNQLLHTLHDMLKDDPTVCGRPLTLRFVGEQRKNCANMLTAHTAAYPDELQIISMGPRPKAEAVAITRASDILLLINPPHLARYIPGKFYEYVATDRPVLVYGSGGEVERIVNETKCGLVVPANDAEGLRSAIAQLVSRDIWNSKARTQWLDQHTREVQAAKMLRILNEVAS